MSRFDRRQFECAYCGARPGEPCVTYKGMPTADHVDRIIRENEAWKRDHA